MLDPTFFCGRFGEHHQVNGLGEHGLSEHGELTLHQGKKNELKPSMDWLKEIR